MKKTNLAALTLAAIFSVTLGATMVFSAGYGMAGCGLGSVILGPEGRFKQLFALTTNATGVQTFGITTGTSNCVEDKGAFMQKQQEIFVSININSLEQEMAMGKGEKLNAFAGLLGCPASKSAVFGTMAQTQFKNLSGSKLTPALLLNSVKNSIAQNSELSSACKI